MRVYDLHIRTPGAYSTRAVGLIFESEVKAQEFGHQLIQNNLVRILGFRVIPLDTADKLGVDEVVDVWMKQ